MSRVTCCVSHITNRNSHSHKASPFLNSPNMTSRIVCKDPKINVMKLSKNIYTEEIHGHRGSRLNRPKGRLSENSYFLNEASNILKTTFCVNLTVIVLHY